jgi:hypothetical protein
MEKKEWSLYTQDEKEALLAHWLHYLGAAIVTGKDLIKFDILAKEYTEDIYRVAINGYINNMNATVLVMSIRNNCVDKLFKKVIKKVELNDAQKEIYESYENDFIDMLVDSYNDPKAPVPLSEDQIIEQLKPILIKRSMQK